ncbi:transposase [Kitasatospora sp. MY 5-36]|uniref:transposase n=1 Tax=Kitasatospora sp. MY 5-36 TaxID=1678027 RepID=UPI0009EC7ADE
MFSLRGPRPWGSPCRGRSADPKPVIRQMAREIGVHHEALRNWIRQDEADRGERDDRLPGARRHLVTEPVGRPSREGAVGVTTCARAVHRRMIPAATA